MNSDCNKMDFIDQIASNWYLDAIYFTIKGNYKL